MKSLPFLLILLFVSLLAGPRAYAQNFSYKQKRYELTYQRQGNEQTLKIKGSIIVSAGENIRALLQTLDRIPSGLNTKIILDMFGGDIAVVNKVYDKLKSKCHDRGYQSCRLTTQVEIFRTCASACIPLFMVGDVRRASERADFGFHQASLIEGFILIPFMSERELRLKGVNADWLKRNKVLFSSLQISWRRPHQLVGSNIVNEIYQHAGF